MGNMLRKHGRRIAADEKPVDARRCVLCGESYRHCGCTCTWCKAKKWELVYGRWQHHVCSGKGKR